MTTTEIREGLREVGQAVSVPALDRTAFQREVRRARRTRSAGRLAVAGAAAAAVAVVAAGVVGLRPADTVLDPPPAQDTSVGRSLSEVLPLVVDQRLMALDPAGTLHDLGMRSEDVIGFTTERIYALDDESHVVVKAVHRDEEGTGRMTFSDAPSPVEGAVSSTAMSSDGRYLAWLTTDDVLHTYDLVAQELAWQAAVPENSFVADVAAAGVLLSVDGDLEVRDGRGVSIPVPTQGDGYGWASSLAMQRVAVVDRDDRTRVYDISTGVARLEATLGGSGTLAPYADGAAWLRMTRDDVSTAMVWDGTTSRAVTGLEGSAAEIAWVQDGSDTGSVLVTTYSADGVGIAACDPLDLACTTLPVRADDSIVVG